MANTLKYSSSEFIQGLEQFTANIKNEAGRYNDES